MAAATTRVAIIGAGVAGLAAALEALDNGADVTVFEAGARVGGKIRSGPFAGLPAVDEGADAFLRRVPDGLSFAQRVGITEFTAPAAQHAAVWWDRMHPIPPGLLLGLPTDVIALGRSDLLSLGGRARAALEPLLPRTSTAPDSLGAWVRARFGDEVHERLVDPLVGSIYAADTDRFSLAAVPQLAELAARGRSVLLAARHRAPAPDGPVFAAPPNGMGALVAAAGDAVTAGGGTIRLDAAVHELAGDGTGWRVDGETFDAVVLAVPAAAAARLLAPLDHEAASTLSGIPTADVIMMSMVVAGGSWADAIAGRSGFLVPKPQQRMVTAVSYGSQKWAHWNAADGELLRVSLGRDGLACMHLDDDQALAVTLDDLQRFHGVRHDVRHLRITRWPAGFAQYRPHHDSVIAGVERGLPAGLSLAGAGFHGIGIPACIRSGRRAGRSASGRMRES